MAQWTVPAAGLCILVAIFAKQICQFNAAYIERMPEALRRLYRWEYLGRDPDDPLWIAITRYGAMSVALLLIVSCFASRAFRF